MILASLFNKYILNTERMQIRKLFVKDAPLVLAVNKKTWAGDKYNHNLSEIKSKFQEMQLICYGAFFEKKLVGFVMMDPFFRINIARIDSLSVLPENQRNGIGHKLLEKIENVCKQLKKESIFVYNTKANRKMKIFLTKNEFKKVGLCKSLYRGDRTAIIYFKKII